jgi:hypothetical protein
MTPLPPTPDLRAIAEAVERLTALADQAENPRQSMSEAWVGSYGPGGKLVLAQDLRLILEDRDALDRLTKALEALERIAQGDHDRPVAKPFRDDGKPSKHDRCPHGAYLYEDCGGCVAEFASQVHAELTSKTEMGIER